MEVTVQKRRKPGIFTFQLVYEVLPSPSDKKAVIIFFVIKRRVGEWALSMVGVEERREFRFRGDLYSQESTFPLVVIILILFSYVFFVVK